MFVKGQEVCNPLISLLLVVLSAQIDITLLSQWPVSTHTVSVVYEPFYVANFMAEQNNQNWQPSIMWMYIKLLRGL